MGAAVRVHGRGRLGSSPGREDRTRPGSDTGGGAVKQSTVTLSRQGISGAMGRASRAKSGGSRQQRIAATRAAERRKRVRNRLLLSSGAVVAVIIIVVVLVVVKVGGSPSTSSGASNGPTGAKLAKVVSQVTTVPTSTLDAVGAGSGVTGKPVAIKGAPLTKDGKPEVVYVGAEYCPYCAAERWAAIVALSRFGTFSNLHTIHSSTTDHPSDIPTFTFYKSTYTSKYLTFTPVEEYTNIPQGSFYKPLQTPTAAEQALVTKYDAPPYVPGVTPGEGPIPFYDFGNKYIISGASYDAGILKGKSWEQIASSLKNPSSSTAKTVDGTANYLTAAICSATGNKPASACTSTVRNLENKL